MSAKPPSALPHVIRLPLYITMSPQPLVMASMRFTSADEILMYGRFSNLTAALKSVGMYSFVVVIARITRT